MVDPPPTPAAAAKNVIIPNAWTPVRMEWCCCTSTTITATTSSSCAAVTNPKKPTKPTNVSVPLRTSRRNGMSRSIVIHQTTHEDTWPGGAIWDLGWCMAQLILGLIHLHDGDGDTTGTGRVVHSTTTFDHDNHLAQRDDEPSQCVLHHTIRLPPRLVDLIRPTTTTTDPSIRPLLWLTAAGGIRPPQQPSPPPKRGRRRRPHVDDNSTRRRRIVLELGAGTGLTGIVLAAAAATTTNVTVLLTDLQVVVDQVTTPNVQRNIPPPQSQHCRTVTFPVPDRTPDLHDDPDENTIMEATPSRPHKVNMYTLPRQHGRLTALPLCWGDPADMNVVQSLIRHLQQETPPPPCEPSRQQDATRTMHDDDRRHPDGIPDLLIIGDVAYQHKPGAASHFDALLETILQLTNNDDHGTTLVLFGLRIRMPASRDLYDLLLQYFGDVIEPIVPHEIDPVRFPIHHGKSISTMTIHLMTRRNDTMSTTIK